MSSTGSPRATATEDQARASATSATTDPGNRSAAEIERDVERTRARLTGTVEELKDRVSPGQMADQAMEWLRGSGGREFLGNLGTTVRDNPMPVLLVAAGIGWLAMASGRSAAAPSRAGQGWASGSYPGESYPGESYPPATYVGPGLREDDGGASVTERVGAALGGLRDTASGMAARAGEALHAATDTARSLAEGASDTGRRAAQRAGEAWDSASGTAAAIGTRASRTGVRARSGLSEAFERQPLLLGAFGLALGAALGALLPRSEAEDRLMGESRDELAERAGALATEAYQDAREKLAERGLTPERGAAALGEVARDLRETVERGAQEAGATVRQAGAPSSGGPASGSSAPGTPSATPPVMPPSAGNQPGGPSSTGMPSSRSGPESGGPV